MAIITLFRSFLDWARRREYPEKPDALDHPDLMRMDLRQISDLPLGEITLQDDLPAAARTRPQLARCA